MYVIESGQVDILDNLFCTGDAADCDGACQIIEVIPRSYDSMLGRHWKKGQERSSRQLQKIT